LKLEAAFVFLFNNENQVLVGTKKSGQSRGKIVFPGGVTKLGESVEVCACRKLFSQTGYISSLLQLKHIVIIHDFSRLMHKIICDLFIFEIQKKDCQIRFPSYELSDLKFVSVTELPLENMSSIISVLMPELFDKKYFFQVEIMEKQKIEVKIKSPQHVI
jgi:ADP-ribose pyrophosphatase YjhB (NUDIX family)